MARVIWTEPALSDLDGIADYIALDDPAAAKRLVQKVFRRVEQLIDHPGSGSIPPELHKLNNYRQLVEPPCRVFYRLSGEDAVYIIHVMRREMLLKRRNLKRS
jgi:toxin ParE1/3/4